MKFMYFSIKYRYSDTLLKTTPTSYITVYFQLNVFIVFSAILIGPLVKSNGFYTSMKTCAYEYLISA